MIRIVKESVDVTADLEKAKREIFESKQSSRYQLYSGRRYAGGHD